MKEGQHHPKEVRYFGQPIRFVLFVDRFCDQLKKAIGRHCHQINANFLDFEMLVAEHESLVTQVEKLSGKECQCDGNGGD